MKILFLFLFSLSSTFLETSPSLSPDVLSVQTRQLGVITSEHHTHTVVHMWCTPGRIYERNPGHYQWISVEILRWSLKIRWQRLQQRCFKNRRKLILRKSTEEPRQISGDQAPTQPHKHKSRRYTCCKLCREMCITMQVGTPMHSNKHMQEICAILWLVQFGVQTFRNDSTQEEIQTHTDQNSYSKLWPQEKKKERKATQAELHWNSTEVWVWRLWYKTCVSSWTIVENKPI